MTAPAAGDPAAREAAARLVRLPSDRSQGSRTLVRGLSGGAAVIFVLLGLVAHDAAFTVPGALLAVSWVAVATQTRRLERRMAVLTGYR